MGLFDWLFKRKKDDASEQQEVSSEVFTVTVSGTDVPSDKLTIEKIFVDYHKVPQLRQRYIALDLETTGLNPRKDRIVEIGAILFENGYEVSRFSSLVQSSVPISRGASAVNHITNKMLKKAPLEQYAVSKLVRFLGDATQGKTPVCAHNADFDMQFLTETFSRLGYRVQIKYIDTLLVSRVYLKGLDNYKMNTVAGFFRIPNIQQHRAAADAEVCGRILWNLFGKIIEARCKKQESLKNAPASKNGLQPNEIAFLADADRFRTDQIDFPNYLMDSYYIDDPRAVLDTLQQRGFIRPACVGERLETLLVPDLKKILSDNALKTSGKKAELIARIRESVSIEYLTGTTTNHYVLTDLGMVEVQENQEVIQNLEQCIKTS